MTLRDTPYMTKPRARVRFLLGAHDDGRLHCALRLPCGGEVCYLGEKSYGALWPFAVGKEKYDPAVDIDRYAVVCPLSEEEADVCPAWDALRREMHLVKDKRIGDDGLSVAVDVEVGGEDDDPRWSCVQEQHGEYGPIVESRKPIGTGGVTNIVTAAEKCEKRGERADGGACDCGGGGNGREPKDEGVHGGIISKIARRLRK